MEINFDTDTVVSSSNLPDELEFESSEFETAKKCDSYANRFFPFIGEYFRNCFYFPLTIIPHTDIILDSGAHAQEVVSMLKGESKDLDSTFPYLKDVVDMFDVKDTPIKIKTSDGTTHIFHTRVIESKEEVNGVKLRLVLFSFYNNQVIENDNLEYWDPKSSFEIASAPLEILKALQQHIDVDSLMCFSLGGVSLHALKEAKENFLPKTVILNRALNSTQKAVSSVFSFPESWLYNQVANYYHLDANPEKELSDYYERFSSDLGSRRVVLLEAKADCYFKDECAFDKSFCERLQKSNVEVYHGSFYIPLLHEVAQHSCRLDLFINNSSSGSHSDHFLPTPKYGNLSDSIVKNVFMEQKGEHTCLILGGNLDMLESITYLQALPLLSSFVKQARE